MFRREELEDWLASEGGWLSGGEDGIYDRLSSGGYQKAADNGPALEILPYLAARPLSSRRHALHWSWTA